MAKTKTPATEAPTAAADVQPQTAAPGPAAGAPKAFDVVAVAPGIGAMVERRAEAPAVRLVDVAKMLLEAIEETIASAAPEASDHLPCARDAASGIVELLIGRENYLGQRTPR